MRIALITFCLVFSVAVHADILCVKNKVKVRNNSVRLANNVKLVEGTTCPAGHTLIKDLNTIKDQQLAAFARLNGSGGVLNYGGATVTGVNVDTTINGRYTVTFIGDFDLPTEVDSEQNQNSLTVNSTAIADNYAVTNSAVISASSSEIVVTIFLWKSDDLFESFQSGINLSVFKGQSPLL